MRRFVFGWVGSYCVGMDWVHGLDGVVLYGVVVLCCVGGCHAALLGV